MQFFVSSLTSFKEGVYQSQCLQACTSSVHAVESLAGKASSRNNFEPICNAFSLQGVFKGSLPFQPVPENGHFVFVTGIKINVQIVLKG